MRRIEAAPRRTRWNVFTAATLVAAAAWIHPAAQADGNRITNAPDRQGDMWVAVLAVEAGRLPPSVDVAADQVNVESVVVCGDQAGEVTNAPRIRGNTTVMAASRRVNVASISVGCP